MHKRLIAILSVLLWVVATQVQAQSVKLGVVNVGMLLEKAPQAQAAGKSLEKEFGPQQTELKRMAAKLEQMQQDYQKIN